MTRRKRIWPVTIIKSRYGGTYSGGRYHAWNHYAWDIPREAYGDDTTCASFWGFYLESVEDLPEDPDIDDFAGCMKASWEGGEVQNYTVAKGSTPEEALDNLRDLT